MGLIDMVPETEQVSRSAEPPRSGPSVSEGTLTAALVKGNLKMALAFLEIFVKVGLG